MRNPYLRQKMLQEFAALLAQAIHLTLSNRLDLAVAVLDRLVVRMRRALARVAR